MKKFLTILILLTAIIFQALYTEEVFAYGIRVQRDYRFTTQQDRNQRIKVYQEYLLKTGIFDETPDVKKKLTKNTEKTKISGPILTT